MKVSESAKIEDDKIIIKKSHDFSGVLDDMQKIRNDGQQDLRSEYRHVGRIPLALMAAWCKEAGVSWDDVHARAEVVKKKILSGDFDKFRSDWKGTY